jgi:hypothetical protein
LPYHHVYQTELTIEQRHEDLKVLRSLKLYDWYAEMDTAHQAKLKWLFDKYKTHFAFKQQPARKPIHETEFMDKTLGDLAGVIYAKSHGDGKISMDWVAFGQLLCGNNALNFARIPLVEGRPMKEINKKMHSLLWCSVLWKVAHSPAKKQEGNLYASVNR